MNLTRISYDLSTDISMYTTHEKERSLFLLASEKSSESEFAI